jgi:RNA polymerase sigma-70 factor, ECF subfamily
MNAALTSTMPRCTTGHDDAITAWALAARGGDPLGVERFVRALHRDVRRYVAYLSADPQAADDLTQDTFLRALGSLHRFEGRSSARTWLLSIARRAVIDSLRYTAARPRLADTDDWQSAAERAQSRNLPGFDDGIALAELLATLPDERREAFVLTQLLGLPSTTPSAPLGSRPPEAVSPRRVEPCPLVRGQPQVHRGQALVQLRHRGGADQRDHGDLAADQPGEDHLVDARAGLLGDLAQCGQPDGRARVVEAGVQGLVLAYVAARQQR